MSARGPLSTFYSTHSRKIQAPKISKGRWRSQGSSYTVHLVVCAENPLAPPCSDLCNGFFSAGQYMVQGANCTGGVYLSGHASLGCYAFTHRILLGFQGASFILFTLSFPQICVFCPCRCLCERFWGRFGLKFMLFVSL